MSDIVKRPWRCDVTRNPVGTDTRMAGAPPCPCQGCRSAAYIERLEAELKWYGEQSRLCRMVTSEGDKGRNALDKDGGERGIR